MIRAHIYLDEDMDPIVTAMLRSQGFSVTTTQEEGRKGKQDADQLEFACENALVMVTHNRVDYQRLGVEYFESGRSHFGIILAIQRPTRQVSTRILRT